MVNQAQISFRRRSFRFSEVLTYFYQANSAASSPNLSHLK